MNTIDTFFSAWHISDANTRKSTIQSAVANDVVYNDPRTPNTIKGVDALCDYVGMFSASAPGWTAKAVKTDSIAGLTRVTVAFSGMGPNGELTTQHGQYFVEQSDNGITKMTGYVGTGEPA